MEPINSIKEIENLEDFKALVSWENNDFVKFGNNIYYNKIGQYLYCCKNCKSSVNRGCRCPKKKRKNDIEHANACIDSDSSSESDNNCIGLDLGSAAAQDNSIVRTQDNSHVHDGSNNNSNDSYNSSDGNLGIDNTGNDKNNLRTKKVKNKCNVYFSSKAEKRRNGTISATNTRLCFVEYINGGNKDIGYIESTSLKIDLKIKSIEVS
ncbi:hypothetical protein ACTA71_009360 [Dictyostelium dimigraforme]